jgi:hypothetical protein
MGASSQNESESTYHNILDILQYAKTAVDKKKDRLISIPEKSQDLQ